MDYPKDESALSMFRYMLSQWRVEDHMEEITKARAKAEKATDLESLTNFTVPMSELQAEGFYYLGPSNPETVEIEACSNGVLVVFWLKNLLTHKGAQKFLSYSDENYWTIFSLWLKANIKEK